MKKFLILCVVLVFTSTSVFAMGLFNRTKDKVVKGSIKHGLQKPPKIAQIHSARVCTQTGQSPVKQDAAILK